MCSNHSNPHLTIIDVGHGSASVLNYEGIVTIFDAGRKGQCLRRYLTEKKFFDIDTLIISHADNDHTGGLISVLLDKNIKIKNLFINSDPTKKTKTHQELRYALCEARIQRGTKIEPQVSTTLNGRFDINDLKIEILYPPPEIVVTGVGGLEWEGNPVTSNSMCAAIRLIYKDDPKVLLGGDINFCCINYWVKQKINTAAKVLIFPHHGGMPSTYSPDDAEKFTVQITELVNPKYFIFSIHKSRFKLPRSEILAAIEKVISKPIVLCTQLPKEYVQRVLSNNPGPWVMHKAGDNSYIEGNIDIKFTYHGCLIKFLI